MADGVRKSLVWDIRKGLFALMPDQLFEIAAKVGPVPGKDLSELSSDDAEGSFEYINSFIYSEAMLEAEDSGMGELLALKDMVDELLNPTNNQTSAVETDVETRTSERAPHPTSEPSQFNAAQVNLDKSDSSLNIPQEELLKMISDYEKVGRTLQGLVKTCTTASSRTTHLTK